MLSSYMEMDQLLLLIYTDCLFIVGFTLSATPDGHFKIPHLGQQLKIL